MRAPRPPPRPRSARPSPTRRSLAASTGEGVFAEVLNACAGGAVLTGWALHLGGGPLAVGVLGALPSLTQLLHLPGAWITASLGRRRVALWSVAISRQAWLPLVAVPFLPVSAPARLAVLLGVCALSFALAVVGNNAWVAWMADLVPRPVRGRYFAHRTAACTLGGTAASLVSGLALDRARAAGREAEALAALAALACVAGALTTALMARQHEPRPEQPADARVRLADALLPLRDRRAHPLLAYQVAWSAAIGLSGAFFTVHMLENLKMGYTLLAVQGAGVAAVRVVAAPRWGRAVDRFGARPVLVACSFAIAAIPLLWLWPTPANLWPVALDALATGVLWSGHSLAAFALPLSLAPARGRPFYLAAFSAAGGLAFALASAAGGVIAARLPREILLGAHTFYGLQALFVVSSALRLVGGWLALRIVEPGSCSLADAVARSTQAGRASHPRRSRASV